VADVPSPALPGLLREPNYRRLFLGQTISLIGDGIGPVAIAFAVLDLTGSASDLGIVLAARSLVITALVLVGCVFADRVSPRVAMLRADFTRMLVMAAIAALLISGAADIWQLVLLYGIEGAATAFFNPAATAIVPQVVGPADLQEANGLLSLSKSAGKVAGPALAGVLLAVATPGWAIAADAASFGLSAAFLLALRVPRPAVPRAFPKFAADLRDGWSEFSSRTWLVVMVTSAAISNAIFWPAFQVLGPAIAAASLGGSGAYALIAAALGAGAVIGGLVSFGLRPRRPLLFSEAMLVLFLPIALFAGPAPTVLIAAGTLVTGITLSIAEIFWQTATAQHVPAAALARVSSYDYFGSLALEPLGLALIGPIAAGVGTSATLWAAAAVLVLCQIAVVVTPSVRRLQARPDGPAGGPEIPLRPLEPGD
jgi:MFS family permease